MWCLNASCGVEGPGPFCQKCGSKMKDDPSLDTVVICNGQLEDGSPCHAVLISSQRFCNNCGIRVDPGLFVTHTKTCMKCGTVLKQGSEFCSTCNQSHSKPVSFTDPEGVLGEKSNSDERDKNAYLEQVKVGLTGEKELYEDTKRKSDEMTVVELLTRGDVGENDEQEKQAHLNHMPKHVNSQAPSEYVSIDKNSAAPLNEDINTNICQNFDNEKSSVYETCEQNVTSDRDNESKMKTTYETNPSGGDASGKIKLSDDGEIEMIYESAPINEKDVNDEYQNPSDVIQSQTNSNTDLSTKLDLIKLGNSWQGNPTVFDEERDRENNSLNQNDVKEEDTKEESQIANVTSDSENDSKSDSKQSDSKTNLESSYDTAKENTVGQSKRVKKQKRNQKRRKKDKGTKERNEKGQESLVNIHIRPTLLETKASHIDLSTIVVDETNIDKVKHTQDSVTDNSQMILESNMSMSKIVENATVTGQNNLLALDKNESNAIRNASQNSEENSKSQISEAGQNSSAGLEMHSDKDSSIQKTEKAQEPMVFGMAKLSTQYEQVECSSASTSVPVNLFVLDKGKDEILASSEVSMQTEETTATGETVANKQKKLGAEGNEESDDDECVADEEELDVNEVNETEKMEKEKDGEQSNLNTDVANKKRSKRQQKQKKKRERRKQKAAEKANAEGRKPVTRSDTRSSDDNLITVHFHVLVSEAFEFDPAKHKLILVFGNEEMGGWFEQSRVMKVKRQIEGCIYELGYEIQISARLVTNASFPYKYFFIKEGSKGHYEHYKQDGKYGIGKDRMLEIKSKNKNLCEDVWHQFDGFAERSPETFFGKLTNEAKKFLDWTPDLKDRAKKALIEFCPKISDIEQLGPTEVIKMIRMLVECLMKVYFTDARCWYQPNSYMEFVGQTLVPAMIQLWDIEAERKHMATKEKETRLVGSIIIICALKVLGIELPSGSVTHTVCKSLLVTADQENNICPELSFLENTFPEKRQLILDAVLYVVKTVSGKTKDPSWIMLMPWVHFLYGTCTPFEKTTLDFAHDKDTPLWWGIEDINLDFFKGKSGTWTIDPRKILEHLQPLFEMDYFLPRTFMAALDLQSLHGVLETGKIPVEVCLANIIYHMRKCKPSLKHDFLYKYKYYPPESEKEKLVTRCLETIVKQLQSFAYSDSLNSTSGVLSYLIGHDLLVESTTCNRIDHVCLSLQACICCTALFDNLTISGNLKIHTNQKIPSLKDMLIHAEERLVKWMSEWQNNWDTAMEAILKVWNRLFAPVSLQSQMVRDEWNKNLTQHLLCKIQFEVCRNADCTGKFVQLYCRQVEGFNRSLHECLGEAAFQAVAKGYAVDNRQFSYEENRRFGLLLSEMFDTEWRKSVEKSTKALETRILTHVLEWAPFHQFFLYYNEKKMIDMLRSGTKENLVECVKLLDRKSADLVNGSVTVWDFKLISAKQEKFVELTGVLHSTNTSVIIIKAIQMRQKELDAFQQQAAEMATLAALCQHLKNVDRRSVDETLRKQDNIQKYMIKEFCEPADPSKFESLDTYVPKVCAFNVPKSVIDEIPHIHRCTSSNIFLYMWTEKCKEVNMHIKSLQDVIQAVWISVKQNLDSISKKIQTGKLPFKEFEKIVARWYGDDYEAMEKEMKILKVKERCARQRTDQLRKYRQLEDCVNGAKTILQFKEEYKLEGDFDQIQNIATHGDNELEMASFNESVMKACDFLKDLTPAKTECLQMFIHCQKVVQWLKESMESDGLKELKVFVDLASMSAGDEPVNNDRVQFLHSAVTGYAPLIFELKKDSGYKELLRHCENVWKDLEANKNLPKMLEEINRNFSWLKEIKKAHGSVEVNSLMQAEAINESGIYTVGINAWKKNKHKQAAESSLQVLADTVQLTVPEKAEEHVTDKENENVRDTDSKWRNYTFSQLQDLQSRLMLVAGKAVKGTDSVDRFTMIFDSITRLSNVYIKLCSSGCVLFKDFTARFFCHSKLPVCIYINFGQGERAPQLKGRRSQKEDLKDIIPQIAKFMETCLDQWLSHIKEKRKDYLHLNYFTVDQLVILQRELVKMGSDTEEPLHHIYPLLSAVKHDCTPADLLDAMIAAKSEIEGDGDMELSEEDTEDRDDKQAEASLDDKKHHFIQELVDAGYDEALVNRALECVDSYDITEGMVWCMENENAAMLNDTEESPSPENNSRRDGLTKKPVFTGWTKSDIDIHTLIATNISGLRKQEKTGAEPLLGELSTLWCMFLESISSNIRDYLSLEHLGIILKHLSRKNTQNVCRNMPPVFKEGEPNLIITPSGEVLMTVLSVYMMEEDQPLPKAEEVLMCTPNTTKDEVDIFWRRALFGEGKKIHCLLNADLLDYDVSEAAERCLHEYLIGISYTEPKYRLLVICGTDNEYKSGIVSSLEKYKRQTLPYNIKHLREYLLHKLTIDQHKVSGIKPAASVDRERSSVRVIKSWRAGVGKTLFKERREDELSRLNRGKVHHETVSIPLQEKHVDLHYVIGRLLDHTTRPGEIAARLFHIDIAHEVQYGVDFLLFNLLILGCLVDKTGFVWRKSPTDLYLIETMPLMIRAEDKKVGDLQYVHQLLGVLPDLTCRSPQESLQIYEGNTPRDFQESDQLFDDKQFHSTVFQRTFQYLYRLDQGRQLEDVNPRTPQGSPADCLETLLKHCGIEDPSWAELHHFVWFLNTQLEDFEKNSFVSAAAAEDLPGFTKFVLRFLITMSRDFSTRSLNMSEQSPGVRLDVRETKRVLNDFGDEEEENEDDLQAYKMRRTWESSPHPYLFFNSDRVTFTFLGFYIDQASGNLVDQQTNRILERSIMAKNLFDALVRNNAPMKENFDALPRDQKITKLCNVMGIEFPHDPDDTYELTTDNVKKIMAIYMRFRCDIPVIIMGETGCGKTRLIKFMCGLQVPPGVEMTNMILMKVHGGTTNRDIINNVEIAEKKARENCDKFGKHIYTVLFFDEANTTEAVGLIKEIMCDKSMEGTKLKLCENLKIVAAVNPYRKHSDELIRRLEQAGLGYHVDADDTTDRLGRVPMRRLVYRVQPLPQSLLPLVWDFGQLNTQVEDLYIRQMVRRYIREDKLPNIPNLKETVSAILTASQEYMRAQEDECSFVSLRDVDRVLTVMSWFYQQSQEQRTLFDLMDKVTYDDEDENSTSSDEASVDDETEYDFEEMKIEEYRVDDVTRSLILALGVCYHACLKTRQEYRQYIARYFRLPCRLPPDGAEQIRKEIECCQEVFLKDIDLEKNIARNMALKENVFMMVVCIELRIPLFLVGKPGSSKSLAKIIVSDAMQGNAAKTQLFKELKQAQMVSFQCSPLSTPDGIVATFKQCAQFQKDKDLETFVSIVVLDEVGLAEDSPRMPLKTLHPLLEDGCQGNEKPEQYQKVAFIGISNWALDPAKMNRGILVQREVPDLEELKSSASGICSTNEDVARLIEPLIEPMAISYREVFDKASQSMREFYGLRDFYSLVKMVYGFVERSKRKPTWQEILHSIMRNFGGLDEVDAVESFRKNLVTLVHIDTERRQHDPDSSSTGLIRACLTDKKNESRYLLLLTENYGALSIIQQQILSHSNDIHPITIFGSSFRSDLEYTQVCRNINKIKVCMETGNTVVLLNLENLYESLYDALNQYYVYFGGERYVDLGLGTHRVKCPVHKRFRLIMVAEKQTVYKKFPIPLINRLEKHFLTINTMLTPEQQDIVHTLQEWTKQFITVERQTYQRKDKAAPKIGAVFIGYHHDTCSAIVLDVWEKFYNTENPLERRNQVLQEAKNVLLWCATPESLVKLDDNHRIPDQEKKYLQDQYNNRQQHGSLAQYLHHFVCTQHIDQLLAQVTTHSRLLAGVHKTEISQCTGIAQEKILLLESLSSFDTEQQFTNRIQHHLRNIGRDTGLMIIQCDSGDVNANLIACARYCVRDELEKMKENLQANVHVVFIVQLPREGKFTGFQCGQWHSVHIDDLFKEDNTMPTLQDMKGRSPAEIFSEAVEGPVDMEIDQIPHSEREFAEEGMEWTNSSKDITLYRRDQTMIFELSGETRNKPVQLDDVQFDVHSFDQNIGRHAKYAHSKVHVKGIILNCVHVALSMVKDQTEHISRETERVSLVLKLLHQDKEEGQSSFFHGVCCLVKKLLAEKESKVHVSSSGRNWLIKEAAANENINKAGTFRRSCQQTLEAKVYPILAGIIAYLDTNDNLSILEDTGTTWKREIWLLFLNTSDAMSLQFSDLQSPSTQTDLQEVLVMSTGYDGHLFRAQMPFSWILISKIAEILKLPHPKSTLDALEGEGTESRVSSTVRVLSEHAIGSILAKITKERDVIEAVKDYIQDFVHTAYKATSEQEYQIVIQHVYDVSRNREENSLLSRLVHVHVAFETLSARLNCFRAMNSVWPECSTVIIEVKDNNPDHFMFRENDFTFSTLCLLIENLTPKSNSLNNQLGRSQWLNNVHRYRPVVERVLCLHEEKPQLYGNSALNSVRRAKCMWSRVMAVKLFLEHVCSAGKDDIIFKHCMTFWTVLGDDTDFKDIKSLIGVEKFLKICYKRAMKEFLGTEKKCSQCESVLEGPPVTLPCKDVLCEHCFDAMRALEENTCHKCQKNFQAGWKPLKQAEDNTATEKLKDYQTRCNAFFMDVVSQLCFADNTEPKEEVVLKLLGLIFITTKHQQQRTRDLTIFETGIDPSPVFRSFLLQLLMRTSEDSVIKNLRRYLEAADRFVRRDGTDGSQHVDLSLLVVQCLEDMFTQKAGRADIDEVQYATQALKRAKVSEESEGLTVEKLYALASARMGLAVVARYIADIVTNNRDQRQVDMHVRKLIEAAQILCEDTHVEWNRVYLVKYMCRCFGIDVYQTICRAPAPFLRWIAIRNMARERVVEVSDRYIVCGEMYITIRESLTKVILGENTTHLAGTLKKMKKHGDIIEPILQLGVHREVTCSNLYPPQQRKITAQIINTLEQFVESCEFVKNKQILQALLNNQLVPRRLVVQEGEELHQQGITCLIVHYLSVMTNIQGDRTLLDPLISLINRPESMLNAFLPTMPQDELEDAKEALLAARNQINGADDNPVFYKCPNGHIYVIGNCGRPSVVDRCTCGAEIGGQNHNLLPSNTQYTGRDTTLTGHILGHAEARARGAQPERELSPAYCSAIRLVVHMAMYLGTGNNPQPIQNMIRSNNLVNDVEEFLWHHILRDLDDIHIALGLSLDDVILLMHTVFNGLLTGYKKGGNIRSQVTQWNSKESRRHWETAFSSKFLEPLFKDISGLFKKNNQLLAKDQRLGADPLLCLLYEIETETGTENAAMLEQIPRVWRYRTPVSLQHLRQEVQARVRPNQHKVLQLFLHEEHILRAMRYIPSILRLHRALFHKYQRKLDKAEASQITVAQLRKEDVAGEETTKLLQDFIDAWELVRSSLFLYLCPTEIGGTTIAKEYCTRTITDKTSIAMLLPTMKESGLCSFALLDFLFRKQNDFLDKYFKEAKRDPASMSTVQPRDVTSAHLISYDPQHDIMPLILANCQYSFEIGKGTKIEYDFAGLERQLMDRFLFSKSRIHVGKVLEIDLMQYRTEFTNAEVFRKLEDKIPQETLGTVVKTQIVSECRSLPDLCQSLDNLDITISFLKSTGGPPDRRLHEFMRETLQMESSVYSQKAQQCEFRHLRSLWLLLSLQKSKKMADSGQHTKSIFESVSKEFHEEMPEELYTLFMEYAMNKLSLEKLTQLVEILHEYILLVVAVRQQPIDEYTVTTNMKVCEWLTGYLERFDQPPLDVAVLVSFPEDILYKHSVQTWVSAYTFLKQRQSRDRY